MSGWFKSFDVDSVTKLAETALSRVTEAVDKTLDIDGHDSQKEKRPTILRDKERKRGGGISNGSNGSNSATVSGSSTPPVITRRYHTDGVDILNDSVAAVVDDKTLVLRDKSHDMSIAVVHDVVINEGDDEDSKGVHSSDIVHANGFLVSKTIMESEANLDDDVIIKDGHENASAINTNISLIDTAVPSELDLNNDSEAMADNGSSTDVGVEFENINENSETAAKIVNIIETKTDTIESVTERGEDILSKRERQLLEMNHQLATAMSENQELVVELEDIRNKLQVSSMEVDRLRLIENADCRITELENDLVEKEDQIRQLLQEGEKLSKTELQNSNMMKKMRTKIKQDKESIAALQIRIDNLEASNEKLTAELKERDNKEKKMMESIDSLSTERERTGSEREKKEKELASLTEKIEILQRNIAHSQHDVEDLRKKNNDLVELNAAASMAAATAGKEETKARLFDVKCEYDEKVEALTDEIDQLRRAFTRTEAQFSRKEDALREQIEEVQLVLREAESRNQDLMTSLTQASKPLLRQIESLQCSHAAQVSSWELAEASMHSRVQEAEREAAAASASDRTSSNTIAKLKAKLVESKNCLEFEKSEKLRLVNELEAKHLTLEGKLEECRSLSSELDALKETHFGVIEEAAKDRIQLQEAHYEERKRIEAEWHNEREALLRSQAQVKVANISGDNAGATDALESGGSSASSIMSDMTSTDVTTPSVTRRHRSQSILLNATNTTATAAIFERSQALLNQREGEIASLRLQLNSLESSRLAMAEEVVALTTRNDNLSSQIATLPLLEADHHNLSNRYDALLQMYGAKVEEVSELRLDIQDVTSLYKGQITDLIDEVNSLKR